MGLERPTIVLFDMDGTTVRHISPKALGILEFIDDAVFSASAFSYRKRPHPDFSLKPSRSPSLLVHRALHSIRRQPIEQIVQPCPGIVALLKLFQENGIPMGIVSNGLGKGYGHDILVQFGLEPFFKAQIFREDITRSKPNPEPILRALREIKDPLTADDVVWYIGDRRKDVIAALAADETVPAKIIPFSYGVKGAVAILERGLNPEQIIMNYTDFAGRIYPLMLQASISESEK